MSTHARVAAWLACVLFLGVVAFEPSVPAGTARYVVHQSAVARAAESAPQDLKQDRRGQWLDVGTPGPLVTPEALRRVLADYVSFRKDRTPWWTPLGPDFIVDGQIGVSGLSREVAGRVISVAVHPDPKQSPDVWLVGTAGGGIWHTDNGGRTWKPAKMPGAPSSLAVGAIAYGSGTTVYAGTGDVSPQGLSGSGLLVSPDSGATWYPFRTNLDSVARTKGRAWLGTAVTGIVTGPRGADCRDGDEPGDAIWVGVAASTMGTQPHDDMKLGLFYLAGCRRRGGDPEFREVFEEPGRPVSDLKQAPPEKGASAAPRVDCVFVARPGAPLLLDRLCPPGNRSAPFDRQSLTPPQYLHLAVTTAKLAAFPKDGSTLYLGVDVPPASVQLLRTDHAWADARPLWDKISFDQAATPTNPSNAVGYCSWDPASGTPKKNVCHHANTLSVSPTDRNVVFAGGVALWRCGSCKLDGPPSWRDISYLTPPRRTGDFISPSDGIHVDQQAMAWSGDEQRGYRLIVVNDGGVWSASDPSRSDATDRVRWANHSLHLGITQIYRGALDRRRPSVVFAGTQDTGTIRRYSPLPGRWLERWRWIQGGDGVGVVVSHHDPALHWATLHQSVLVDSGPGKPNRLAMWRTRDAGLSFQRADLGIERDTSQWVPPFVQCPHPQSDVLLYGDLSLWRVEQFFRIPTLRGFEGASPPTWQRNYRPRQGSRAEITAVAFAPDPDGTPPENACRTYALADTTGRVYLTRSGGGVPSTGLWEPVGTANQWPNRTVSALAFASPTVLYAAIATYSGKESGEHVFRINLAKETKWTDITPGPGLDVPFKSLAIIPRDAGPVVFAGSTLGVWMSPYGDHRWCRLPVDHNTPDVWVEDLRIHERTRAVYAFTFGRGVFRLEDVEGAVAACQRLLKP